MSSSPHSAASSDLSVGFDLGGTNLRAAVFRGLSGCVGTAAEDGSTVPSAARPIIEHRELVGEDRSPERIVRRIADLVPSLLRQAEVGALRIPVGIGFAGMLDGHEGYVVNSPNLGWRNIAFGKMLQEALGDRYPVGIYNDANAITYGEYAIGAGVGASDILAIFVGTGIGAGAVCGHQLLAGATNTAAEIGHTKIVFDESARPCACGLKGCVEAYVGGANLQHRARVELSEGVRSIAVRLAGGADKVNPGHLDEAAAEGDDYALELFAEVAPMLGIAVANAVTLLNPERLVLGGGVLSRTPVLREHVLAAFQVAVNPPALRGLSIVDATLGDDGGLVGSALLASR